MPVPAFWGEILCMERVRNEEKLTEIDFAHIAKRVIENRFAKFRFYAVYIKLRKMFLIFINVCILRGTVRFRIFVLQYILYMF